jgi:hypothetical protein
MVEKNFKPTAGKEYYIFSFKDIVRVYRGLFKIDIKNPVSSDQLAKVLYNELNRQFLDRLNSVEDIKTYFECIEPIVKDTLEKRDLSGVGCKAPSSNANDGRPIELQMQPVFLFEQFYEDYEYTDCTDKFHDTFREDLVGKLENFNSDRSRGSVDFILIDDALRYLC